MTVVLLSIANYSFVGIASIYVTMLCMREVFGVRRSGAPLLAFYTVRFIADAAIFYLFPQVGSQVRLAEIVWSLVSWYLGMYLMAYTFETSFTRALLYSVCFNTVLSCMLNSTYALVNIVSGVEAYDDLFVSLSMRTVVSVALFMLQYWLLRRPMVLLVRGIAELVRRHLKIVMGLILVAATLYMGNVYRLLSVNTSVGTFNDSFNMFLVGSVIAMTLVGGYQVLRLVRETRKQRKIIESFRVLISGYELRMSERLASLECDRNALEGLDTELLAHEEQMDSEALKARVEQLEEGLERLNHGTYCSCNVLDALLVSISMRLQELGVQPHFSVADLTPEVEGYPELLFVLLDAVCALAARSGKTEGEEVFLRLRPEGKALFVRLDYPGAWGRMGAARLLRRAGLIEGVLASERTEGIRTVVLMRAQALCSHKRGALHEGSLRLGSSSRANAG